MEASVQPGVAGQAPDARIVAFARGALLCSTGLAAEPASEWFDPAWWRARGALREGSGGRGGVAFLDTPAGACVLRHYRRGGWVAPVLGDRYLWSGRGGCRSFVEFKLLMTLSRRGLPVPVPVAARYLRRGFFYTADLITRTIERAQTLAEAIRAKRFDAALAARVGGLIAQFHRADVDHADLNAHNILLADDDLWLIDFDRGEIRATGTAWKLANLARLKRSLLKVGACDHDEALLDREVWAPLMRAYERAIGNHG
ncbi:MAG TPA: 3-deoxy-D-manno-octulosonic acid kinase [Rhodanobacteraceae bacterium]